MPQKLIDGVKIKKLTPHHDERGFLVELLRSDDREFYQKFGQCYITAVYPGVVKAWHCHRRQTDHFIGIRGMAKVVLYDGRDGSPTSGLINEFIMGEMNLQLLRIPNMVMHGFMGLGNRMAMILNVPTEVYDRENPDELREPWNTPKIPYDWAVKNG